MATAMEIVINHKCPISIIKQITQPEMFNPSTKKKPSKFLNKWVVIDGIKFQSIGEGNYYLELKSKMQKAEIQTFKRQVPFEFFVNGIRIGKYIADFAVIHFDFTIEVIDYKSRFTATLALYQMKKQLMQACYGVVIKEVGVKK